MITEDYVSVETAKLLKEKGFDEITFTWYNGKGKFCVGKNNFDDYHMNHFSSMAITAKDKNKCSAPTLQTAMKWIRKKHNLYIDPYPEDNNTWCLIIWELYPKCVKQCKGKYDDLSYLTPEEACEAAIRYCLENLI